MKLKDLQSALAGIEVNHPKAEIEIHSLTESPIDGSVLLDFTGRGHGYFIHFLACYGKDGRTIFKHIVGQTEDPMYDDKERKM